VLLSLLPYVRNIKQKRKVSTEQTRIKFERQRMEKNYDMTVVEK
jgi:hypothetical protein